MNTEAVRDLVRDVNKAFGPFLVLIGLILVLRIAVGENFFSPGNLSNALQQSVLVTVGALAMTMLIVAGGIDLSCGSSIALSGVVAASVLTAGGAPILAIAAAVASGALVGAVNGITIARLRLLPFIVTLGMLGVARGAAKAVANEQTVNPPKSWINALMQPLASATDPAWQRALIVAPGVWITVLVAIVVGVLMQRTVFGRHLYAIGSNAQAARLCGIRIERMTVAVYTLAGAVFGLAGVLSTARLRQGDPTTAVGLELDIIAAVVIGGASLNGGVGSVTGSVVGALILVALRNGSQSLGWSTYMQEIIIGVVIVVAVALDRLRHRRDG